MYVIMILAQDSTSMWYQNNTFIFIMNTMNQALWILQCVKGNKLICVPKYKSVVVKLLCAIMSYWTQINTEFIGGQTANFLQMVAMTMAAVCSLRDW